MNTPLKKVLELFDALEKGGVRYCQWKSNQHLAEAMTGETDLDVLVDKNQAARFESIATWLGYKRFTSQVWARYPGIEDWIGFDDKTGKLVHVHLHYQLVLGGKFVKEHHLPWEDLVLSSAIKDGTFKIFITDPNLEIILLSIRIGLKTSFFELASAFGGRSAIDKHLWKEFEYLSGQVDEGLVEKYAIDLFGERYGRQFSLIINQQDVRRPDVIFRIKSILNKSLDQHRRFSRAQVLGIYVFRVFRAVFAKIQRRLNIYSQTGKRLQASGAIIAIIGCDGSGKSTLSRELQKWLAWKIDVHRIYLGSGDGSIGLPIKFMKYLASSTGRKVVERPVHVDHQAVKNGHQKPSFLKEIGSGLLDLSIANERRRKVKEANQVRLAGGILITDRYPQNQFPGIYDGPRVSRNGGSSAISRFFARLEDERYQEITKLPPDVVIKLYIPLEVAMQRKPGHKSANIQQKAEITQKLKFTGSKVFHIDTSESMDEVLIAAKKAVWESL